MTPVMDRCACPAAYPLVECVTCTPTPPRASTPTTGSPSRHPHRRPGRRHRRARSADRCRLVLAVWVGLGLAAWGVVGLVAWGLWEIGSAIVRALS
jgi:hypothetical protein